MLGACELIHISVCQGEKNCSSYAENIRRQGRTFHRLGDQAPGICAPLAYTVSKNNLQGFSDQICISDILTCVYYTNDMYNYITWTVILLSSLNFQREFPGYVLWRCLLVHLRAEFNGVLSQNQWCSWRLSKNRQIIPWRPHVQITAYRLANPFSGFPHSPHGNTSH